jgi:PhnB protein
MRGDKTMTLLNAYLSFNGNCRQAMEFYASCLGADLKMQTVGESPMASQVPPQMKNQILHAKLEKDGMLLMASDTLSSEKAVNGSAISLCLNGKSKKEIEIYFNRLAEGGKITNPLSVMFFGTYGDLVDKFGIRWLCQADETSS